MKWSWKLAHVAGIGVSMHATFLLLIGWVALRHWLAEQSLAAVLAGIAFILATGLEPLTRLSVTSGPFLERLLLVNVFLVGFNLLPALPMDGGRVLRALLATRMEYTRATQIAALIGQGTALVFGFLGLVGSPVADPAALATFHRRSRSDARQSARSGDMAGRHDRGAMWKCSRSAGTRRSAIP